MAELHISDGLNVAVLLPCYNEALTIGDVVRRFVEAVPNADIYVFDNNSTDDHIDSFGDQRIDQ